MTVQLVNCAPGTPCTVSGPSNTGTGDAAWLAFGKVNAALAQLYDTPLAHGAVGNGVTDDTTAVQACVTTGSCFLPAGYNFLVSSPIQVPNNGTLIGAGVTSVLTGSAVSGGVVQVGNGGSTAVNNAQVSNFRIRGTATNALKVNDATNLYIGNIWTHFNATADSGSAPVWTDGFYLNNSFNSSFTNLTTNGSTIGGTATFTGSVGGATSGTLNASFPSGVYNFVFSNGQRRPVTVSAGTAASWSTALNAGTITTAWYGACIRVGGSFSANFCSNWLTSNVGCAYNVYIADDMAVGLSIGTTFDAMCVEGAIVGLYVGNSHGSHTFNSLFSETVVMPVVLGSSDLFTYPYALTFNSPVLSGPATSQVGYALRIACINFDFCYGVTLNSPNFNGCYGIDQAAPLTFSGGGSPTAQASGYGLVNAAGVIKAVVVTFPGAGYGSNPTVAVGGAGSSGAVTAVESGGTVTTANLTLSNGGSGYANASYAALMPILYNAAQGVQINNPFITSGTLGASSSVWPWIVRASGSGGQGITIFNDNVDSYLASGYFANANLTRTGLAFGNDHWLSYLTGTGPQGTPPTTNWVLVAPPAFP